METFCIKLEMMDERFHRRVKFMARGWRYFTVRRIPRTFRQAVDRLLQDLAAFLHFCNANQEAVIHIASRSDGDLEIEVFVAAIRIALSKVPREAATAGDRAGSS